ncbi:MAG: carbonic anhydrase, partial [Beijerinckiaceae bacterium]
YLGIRHIIVCGHYGCGGIERILSHERGALVDHWLQPISMMYRKHRAFYDHFAPMERLDRLCELNIEMQVRRLAQTPIIEKSWLAGRELHLHGWIYAIQDGLLRDLGPHLSGIAERDALASIDERARAPVRPLSSLQRQAASAFTATQADAAAGGCGCH